MISKTNFNPVLNPNCNNYQNRSFTANPDSEVLKSNPPMDTVELGNVGENSKASKGKIGDKNFVVNVSEKWSKRILSGQVDDNSFEITDADKLFKSGVLSGKINDKEINLKSKGSGLFGKNIVGNIGDKKVDIKIKDTWSGKRLVGNFEGEDINIKIKSNLTNKKITGKNIDLTVKSKKWYSDDSKIQGKFEANPDLIPILFCALYSLKREEELAFLL